jgi:hypothetical protein
MAPQLFTIAGGKEKEADKSVEKKVCYSCRSYNSLKLTCHILKNILTFMIKCDILVLVLVCVADSCGNGAWE